MLPDRVFNPAPDLRVRCPTDCATRPSFRMRSPGSSVGQALAY